MEILINDKHSLANMPDTLVTSLEEEIPKLLDQAVSVIHKKGRAIVLYRKRGDSYIVFSDGIHHSWKARLPNGDPITDWNVISREEFLKWVSEKPDYVRETVRSNLTDYITTKTPKERGEVEFPEPQHAFGY